MSEQCYFLVAGPILWEQFQVAWRKSNLEITDAVSTLFCLYRCPAFKHILASLNSVWWKHFSQLVKKIVWIFTFFWNEYLTLYFILQYPELEKLWVIKKVTSMQYFTLKVVILGS
jgi:hypothetical protein